MGTTQSENSGRAPGGSEAQRAITISAGYNEKCQNPKGEVTKGEKKEKHCSYFTDVPGE